MIDLIHGNSVEIAEKSVAPGSVDLIFTDPPYQKKYLNLYKWLAREATRALKPSGFLIAYAGEYWKDIVMSYLSKELQYFYDFALIHRGNTTILWPRRIITGYKSLLCFHLKFEKPLPKTNVLGKWNGEGGDKRFHRWGQDAGTARYYIDCFTNEGDLVVDYFLGGGTFAEVCKRMGRNFIGIESDLETFNVARARVDGALGPKEKGRQYEMELIK